MFLRAGNDWGRGNPGGHHSDLYLWPCYSASAGSFLWYIASTLWAFSWIIPCSGLLLLWSHKHPISALPHQPVPLYMLMFLLFLLLLNPVYTKRSCSCPSIHFSPTPHTFLQSGAWEAVTGRNYKKQKTKIKHMQNKQVSTQKSMKDQWKYMITWEKSN